MNNQYTIPQEKFNAIMFDLLIHTRIELQVLRDMLVTEYVRQTDEDFEEIKSAYDERLKEVTRVVQAQLKAHYSDFDVDEFLKNL